MFRKAHGAPPPRQPPPASRVAPDRVDRPGPLRSGLAPTQATLLSGGSALVPVEGLGSWHTVVSRRQEGGLCQISPHR